MRMHFCNYVILYFLFDMLHPMEFGMDVVFLKIKGHCLGRVTHKVDIAGRCRKLRDNLFLEIVTLK